jgi:hypothetical protein
MSFDPLFASVAGAMCFPDWRYCIIEKKIQWPLSGQLFFPPPPPPIRKLLNFFIRVHNVLHYSIRFQTYKTTRPLHRRLYCNR